MTRSRGGARKAERPNLWNMRHNGGINNWMPQYDPAYHLGPFLQIPAYLPSGPAPNPALLFGKAAKHVPRVGAEIPQPMAQMRADASSFVPGLYQVPPQYAGNMVSPDVAAIAMGRCSGPGGNWRQLNAMVPTAAAAAAASIARSMTSSRTGTESTSTGSLSGSAHEQDDITVTSEDTNDVAPQQIDVAASAHHKAAAAARLQAAAHVSRQADWRTNMIASLAKTPGIQRPVPASPANEDKSVDNKDSAESPGVDESVCEMLYGFDGSFSPSPDFDSLVIDPEAPDEVEQIVMGQQAFDRTSEPYEAEPPPGPSSIASSKTNKTLMASVKRAVDDTSEPPGLDVVIGCWYDANNSWYEVRYDHGTTASCHVKTTRPGGVVRETSALIRVGQLRGKSAGRIIWGSAYVLETPIKSPAGGPQLSWKSMRNGRDFSWTRDSGAAVEAKPMPQVEEQPALEHKAAWAPSLAALNCLKKPKEHEEESELKEWDGESDGCPGTPGTRRVWRKPNLCAALSRRVQARSGEWRAINKGQK